MQNNKINILVTLRNLGQGGIFSLYKNLFRENVIYKQSQFNFHVAYFFEDKNLKKQLDELEIGCLNLNYKGKFDFIKLGSDLKSYIKKNNIHLIHSNTPFDRLFVFLHHSKFPDVPHISSVHSSTIFSDKHKDLLKRIAFNYLDKYLLAKNKIKLIAVSNFVKDILVNKGISKNLVTTIYSGIPDRKLGGSRISNPNKLVFLSIGRFHKDKNQLVLIPLLKELLRCDHNRSFKLIFLGKTEGEYFLKVKDLVEKLNLTRSVFFEGYKEDVNVYLKNCDALLFPSKHEALGITLLEAMRSQTLIFSSGIGGIKEVIKNHREGVYIDFNDSRAAASSILSVLDDSESVRQISNNSRKKYIEKFESKKFYEKYRNFYFSHLKLNS